MSAVVAAIYSTLSADSTFTGYLSTFNGSKAIFSIRKVPDGVQAPYCHISGPVAIASDDTLRQFGRFQTHDVSVIFPNTGSVVDIDAASERIRTLFHKPSTAISVTGFQTIQTSCTGPFEFNFQTLVGDSKDTVDLIARVVSITFILRNS